VAKRGPKPKNLKGSAPRKGPPTSIRLPPALSEAVRIEAARANRSFADEVEARLTASFDWRDNIETNFGGQKSYRLFQMIAFAVRTIERDTGKRWWNDRFTFDHVKAAVDAAFEKMLPPGESEIPARMRDHPELFDAHEINNLGRRTMLFLLYILKQDSEREPERGMISGLPLSFQQAAAFLAPLMPDTEDQAIPRKKKRGHK
jgi:hypothetical protein